MSKSVMQAFCVSVLAMIASGPVWAEGIDGGLVQEVIRGFSGYHKHRSELVPTQVMLDRLPPDQLADTLVAVWERSEAARINVLVYIVSSIDEGKVPLSAKLWTIVERSLVSSDGGERSMALEVARRGKLREEVRTAILARLADSDDRIRGSAVSIISRWPDGKVHLERYLATGKRIAGATNDKNYTNSMDRARSLLNEMKQPR
jgi:hypothetical protein